MALSGMIFSQIALGCRPGLVIEGKISQEEGPPFQDPEKRRGWSSVPLSQCPFFVSGDFFHGLSLRTVLHNKHTTTCSCACIYLHMLINLLF